MHNQFKTQKFKHLMLAMGPRDLNSAPYSPVHCSSHSMTSFQSSELTELLVVEKSQLFAQRVHSARYAPKCQKNTIIQAWSAHNQWSSTAALQGNTQQAACSRAKSTRHSICKREERSSVLLYFELLTNIYVQITAAV